MKMRIGTWLVGAACVLGLAAVQSIGQDDTVPTESTKKVEKSKKGTEKVKSKKDKSKKGGKKGADEAESAVEAAVDAIEEGVERAADAIEGAAGAPAVDEAAMMQKWMEMMTPGKEHEFLKRYEGKWDTTTKVWMAGPDGPAEESAGTAEYRMIMDGRYLVDEFEGQMMGMPFTGHGTTGYDKFKKCYVATWMDSMSTGILTLQGHLNREGDVLTMYGQMDEPMTGESDKAVKYKTHFVSDDEMVFTVYDLSVGDDYKAFEITFKRQK